jgi:16S rRNA (cytidine1402-2'-O)-methyltransferase
MHGTLFVVATPIGNLEDFTFRGVRTLREVDLIAAEDTRRTSKLLAHYDIQKPLVSLREHNESRETDRLLSRLAGGESIALVSDAGTPVIADPGAGLIAAARRAGIRIVPIPGASAVATALSGSGLPGDQFLFLGFPPTSGSARDRWFEAVAASPRTVVFYEAPHRIDKTMGELAEYLVDRPTIVCRELTKIHEELVEWPLESPLKAQGEFAVVVGPGAEGEQAEVDPSGVAALFGQITDSTSLSEQAVENMLAAHYSTNPVRIRRLLKKGRILQKRAADNL